MKNGVCVWLRHKSKHKIHLYFTPHEYSLKLMIYRIFNAFTMTLQLRSSVEVSPGGTVLVLSKFWICKCFRLSNLDA